DLKIAFHYLDAYRMPGRIVFALQAGSARAGRVTGEKHPAPARAAWPQHGYRWGPPGWPDFIILRLGGSVHTFHPRSDMPCWLACPQASIRRTRPPVTRPAHVSLVTRVGHIATDAPNGTVEPTSLRSLSRRPLRSRRIANCHKCLPCNG